MRSRQLSIFENEQKKRYSRTEHGGRDCKGKRKLERPLSKKDWIHLVLKSDKAKGKLSFLTPTNYLVIQKITMAKAKKFGIKISDSANVGNHIHLKIKIHSREGFQKFLKALTTLIARQVTGARRGKPFGRFWQGLAYTRVLKSRTEELNLQGYIAANRIEARYSVAAREKFLKMFNSWVYHQRGDPLTGDA